MAKPPIAAAPPMPADAGAGGDAAADMDLGADAGADAGDENVLLTVVKEADGSYSLIKGDEQEADGTDLAGSSDVAGSEAEANKQAFDNVGSLLKAILDLLNEDQSSEGADGSSDDQFNAGFDESASPKPAAPAPQKF